MKTRHLKVTGEIVKPLPDSKSDQATHSIILTDEDYSRCVNSTYFKLVNGEPATKPIEEWEAESIAKKNVAYDKSLKSICESYQHNEGECNTNFFALLTSSRGVAKSLNVPLGPKAQACIDWCDALWLDYYSRKGDYTKGSDFSNHGVVPYSFTEVRAESEGL